MATDLLKVEGLTAGYGASVVLDDLSFTMADGRSLALLGRNGVGKSTLIATLAGHTRQIAGRISVAGVDITGRSAVERVRAGLGWVPQERRMFASLTVEENLKVAARPGPWNLSRIFELFPRLEERRRNPANKLSGGEQQMVAIARALMTNPRLLLLDEPLEGLAPVIVQEVESCIRAIVAQEGMSVILTEQHVKFALRLTHDVLVLDRGRNVHFGPSSELAADPTSMARLIGLRRGAESGKPAGTAMAQPSEI